MSAAGRDIAFSGGVPGAYETHLVPLLFQPYAEDLVVRLASRRPGSVLETACGTGVLTRVMAAKLPDRVSITATDLNPPMLDQAAALGTPRAVEWRPADALDLPFPAASFDAVACQFGVMFFPDRPRGYAEARRVLRRGGGFLFSSWDRIADNELAQVVQDALAPLFPDDPPRFMERTPHGYADVSRIAGDLAAAGFEGEPRVETVALRSRARSARNAAAAFCLGTPLRGEIESHGGQSLEDALRAAEEALARRFGNGEIDARMQAHIVEIER